MKKWTRPKQIVILVYNFYPRLTVPENGQSLASANHLRVCVLEIACFVLNTYIYIYIFLEHYIILFISTQGSEFVVAMVANAAMFSHLLPGCSCGSKHLLLP